MLYKNIKIVLKSRPEGFPSIDNFSVIEEEISELQYGQVVVEVIWLSLDPYMRGRMSAAKSYALPIEIGEVCLLYTSPSPRDYAASRMPSSA